MTEKLTVGQEVRVFERSLYRKDPEGGYVAQVTYTGRKYANAAYEVDNAPRYSTPRREIEFDMATGYEKGDQHGNGRRVRTLAQLETDLRLKTAEAVLADHRVELRPGHSLSLEQVEAIAAILRPDHKPEEN